MEFVIKVTIIYTAICIVGWTVLLGMEKVIDYFMERCE